MMELVCYQSLALFIGECLIAESRTGEADRNGGEANLFIAVSSID